MYFYHSTSKKIKKWTFILTLSFITAWFLYLYTFPSANTFKTGLNDAIFYKGNEQSNMISLTFNIEEGTHMVPSLLHILQTEQISNATFFLNGQWASENPTLVKEIAKNGHEVAMMGYTNESYKDKNRDEILRDFKTTLKVFHDLDISVAPYIRTPKGYYDETVVQAAAQRGLTIIDWSIDSFDRTAPSATDIISNVVSTTKSGDVILLHGDNYSLLTKKALPQIIKQLKAKGFENGSISELISNTDTKSKIVN